MLTIIVFILILGLLIFVHELGHFLIARRNGVRAEEFGFGFPPRILGIQFMKGSEHQEKMELESLQIEKIGIKNAGEEIIKETITEKIHKVNEIVPVKKWRIIWGSQDGDDENEKKDLHEAHEKDFKGGTIYSLNWIPLGGFVKIKGENGDVKGEDSFASKGAWVRTKVLAAGVIMNFVLAWILITFVLIIGAPEAIDSASRNFPDSKIQISEIIPESPASVMGLQLGDEILKGQRAETPDGKNITFTGLKDVQDYISSSKGTEISLKIKRGNQILNLKGVPRLDFPEGQGPLGISMVETAIVRYPWYQAIWKGLMNVFDLTLAMITGLFVLLKNIFMGQRVGVDVAGPVGIAVLTKQVTALGLAYILQFAAILSINLGIINAFPFPALDGGRILFIAIEKIKGRPVSQKTEQFFHSLGFLLLIILMVYITFRDVLKLVK
ncbi:MAG: RIP metalloprotease RseP [Candidatus Moranbacteria bacterium RBG_19FT_COMBO_42_6]|nr:MAG: RIP metalloprotease RseP [Candidatus Moranbacteria bacterium RBG_19FT_COMBO_42_6]